MARVHVKGGLGPGADGVVCDLDVADGELFALAGSPAHWSRPLLRRIAGLDHSKVEITLGEKVVNDLAPESRQVSMVFPSGALFDHLSVGDNLAFGLRARGTSSAETQERVLDAARSMLIEHLLKKPVTALTPELRVRVAIARALTRQPAVMLLDDPLAGLDTSARKALRNDLARAQRRLKVTTLFCTGDTTEAIAIGNRVAIHESGATRQVGTPLDLYERPADRFVAARVGTTPMNLVPLAVENGRVGFGGLSLAVPEETSVVLGLRSEDLSPVETISATLPLRASVDLCEIEGATARVFLVVSGQRLVMTCEARRAPAEGAEVTVFADAQRLRLFSASPVGQALAWAFTDVSRVAPPVFEKTLLDPKEIEALAAAREETPLILGEELTPAPELLLEPRETTPIIEGQELTAPPIDSELRGFDEAFDRLVRAPLPGEGALTQPGTGKDSSDTAGDRRRPAVEATVLTPPLAMENSDPSLTANETHGEATQAAAASEEDSSRKASTESSGPVEPEAA